MREMKSLDPTYEVEAAEVAPGLLQIYAARLPDVADEALSSVVRWEWAHRESEWEGPDPVRRQVYPSLPEPRGDEGRRYGFDAAGVLRVAESVDPGPGGGWEPWCRSMWVWDEGVGSLELYSLIEGDGAVQRLARVAVPDVSGGRMVGLATRFDDGRSWIQRFEYGESGQVIRRFEFWDPAPMYQGPRARYDYTYDDAGLVLEEMVAVDAHGDELPEREVTFRRALPDAVRVAQRDVASELPSRVRTWAERVGSDGDAYCLILGYDVVSHALPPTLALGRSSDRPPGEFELDEEIWSGPDFSTFAVDPPEFAGDAAFMEACALVSEEWLATADEDAPRKFLERCAQTLRADDWSAFAWDGDFVVLVLDSELDTLRSALAKAGPKDVIDRIRERLS